MASVPFVRSSPETLEPTTSWLELFVVSRPHALQFPPEEVLPRERIDNQYQDLEGRRCFALYRPHSRVR